MRFKESISPLRIIFITCVLLLAALSYYSYRQNQELVIKAGLVNHTNVVRFELQNAVSLIKDEETGVRAYILTGIPQYLNFYSLALKNLPASLHTLDSLVADNPVQVKNMRRLRSLTDQKLAYIKTLIASGVNAPTPELLVESESEMGEIASQVRQMLNEEQQLLTLRTSSLNEAVSFAPKMNVVIAGFAILLLFFSYYKILRELEKSNALQKKLQESNTILEKSNSELAQFAYVASHDLQEPLRKIQTFISRIYETENLSDKGRDYFSRVDVSAKRMQQLIRDILTYSRTETKDNNQEKTDLNSVLDTVKEALAEIIKERGAVIRSDKLPYINVVRYQFEQLFQNLLSNALKFSRPDADCIITISSGLVNGAVIQHRGANKNISYHRICFADNGIGFDQQYGDRIFKIFHQLNTKEAYDGNGIGLSIVKKIMESHLGFITAEGQPGKGATFCLYLPAGFIS